MKESRLKPGGEDLFFRIKRTIAEAEKTGGKLIPLAVGQPAGPAFFPATQGVAMAVMLRDEVMHGYQDTGSPGVPDFAQRFVRKHVVSDLEKWPNVDFLPIAGIKSALSMVILASRPHRSNLSVMTMTNPGYGVPATWCKHYLDFVTHSEAVINPENEFRFNPETQLEGLENGLLMINYPHAPSGQVAEREWLDKVCRVCEQKSIRLFNDGAYSVLDHSKTHSTLTDVAVYYSNLSWAEAFSASKALGNATGWRVGAMVGSPDFIGDIRTVKTSTDAGFVPFAAAGVIHAFEGYHKMIEARRKVYEERLSSFIQCLTSAGMRLAIRPKAGFFSLWLTPRLAFGQEITSAEQFNLLMLERVRMFGVPFEPYVRYAVVGDVESYVAKIADAFRQANVSY